MSRRSVHVALGESGYDVIVGESAVGEIAALVAGRRRAAIVTQPAVAGLHSAGLLEALDAAGVEHETFLIGDGEEHKTLRTIEVLASGFAGGGLLRGDAVVALGGGLVGELLRTGASPSQAVFLNTFSSLKSAVADLLAFPWISNLASDWNSVKGITRYTQDAHAHVLIVYTEDDAMFSSAHADRLCAAAGEKCIRVGITDGGHNSIVRDTSWIWFLR